MLIPKFVSRCAVVVFIATSGLLNQDAVADIYTIDTLNSYLTISGNVNVGTESNPIPVNFTEQVSGSLMNYFSGTLDVTQTGSNNFTIDGDNSSLIAEANSNGPFLPSSVGTTDNYGLQFTYDGEVAYVAIRNIEGTIDGSAVVGVSPTGLTLGFDGLVDSATQAFLDSEPVANTATSLFQYDINTDTITIPVLLSYELEFDVETDFFPISVPAMITVTGQIVASPNLMHAPEPSSAALLLMTLSGVALRRRRKTISFAG